MVLRNDPFRELDRLFSTALRSPATGSAMPLDLYREGDSFTAEIDLPGVEPDSIDIDIDDGTLTIRAERATRSGEGITWLTRERPTGTFARQLSLGRGVSIDNISATYRDGVLALRIPIAEEAKPRKIAVEHTGSTGTISAG
ncbi:MAG TPA: Hsp20/alpha crystallin family protein [Actinomycetaceae bacterium]|nr:Hsp20/alpha crystallin family protein [Actinomycetaceae bacterium]